MKLPFRFTFPLTALMAGALSLPLAGPAQAQAARPEGTPPPVGAPMPFAPPGHPMLHGIALSGAQQDKLFDLALEQARPLREKWQALEQAEAALAAGRTDEARLPALVEARARAWADFTLLRLRSEGQMLALLTPEQRRQVENRRPPAPPRERPEERRPGEAGHPPACR
jgi:Spy/CpxP family protein refolding chaperone